MHLSQIQRKNSLHDTVQTNGAKEIFVIVGMHLHPPHVKCLPFNMNTHVVGDIIQRYTSIKKTEM